MPVGPSSARSQLLGVRPDDGASVELPTVLVRPGGYRFLPNGTGLVYLPRIQSLDFWLLDFATKQSRQLTRFSNQGALRTFDITPDGKAHRVRPLAAELGHRPDRSAEIARTVTGPGSA